MLGRNSRVRTWLFCALSSRVAVYDVSMESGLTAIERIRAMMPVRVGARTPGLFGAAIAACLLVHDASAEDRRPAVASAQTLRASELIANLEPDIAQDLFKQGWALVDTPGPEDGHFDGFEALVIFELPPDQVMGLLSQTTRQREFRPDLSSIDTIEQNEDGSVEEHRMRVMFVKIVYRLHYHVSAENSLIQWKLKPAPPENSLDEIEGFWELHPMQVGRTLARFGSRVRIGKALPSFLENIVTRSKLPENIKNSRRWVNSNGSYRP